MTDIENRDVLDLLSEKIMSDALERGAIIDGVLCERLIWERGAAAREITRLRSRVAELESERFAILAVIPIDFLKRHDAPGATGPTPQLDLVGAIRELVSMGRRWEEKARSLVAEVARLKEALETILSLKNSYDNPNLHKAAEIARAALSRIDTPEPPVDRDDKKRITDLEAACLAAKSLLEPTDDRTEMAWQLLDEAYHERKLFTGISTGRDPIAKEDDGWRPIESAPRDGSSFWGRCGNDAVSMFWHEGFGEFISSFRRMTLADGYTFKNGATFEDHSPAIHKPTGWRPRLASADSTDTVTDPIADAVAKENEGE